MTDGGFVHRYVPGRDGSRRTLLLLHGTGGNENDLLPLGAELDPQAGLLSPRGKVLENGAPRFFRRLAEGIFDLEDLKFRTDELAEFVGWAVKEYDLDATQVYAVGYSNGANIAGGLFLRQPDVLAGAAMLHAMVPYVPDELPDLSGKSILLTAGENDPIVTTDETTRLHSLLQRAGADVRLAWFRNGHRLSGAEVHAAAQWLESLA